MAKKISVYELVRYLKTKNEQDNNLVNVTLSGELSNIKVYPSKHMYFDLKDDKAKISGIMFAQATRSLNFKPIDGDQVVISGSVKVYQNNAIFQIIAAKIEKDGYGDLFIQFEENKKKLEKEGYFEQKHKKEIPLIPSKIAVIAGHNSAALKDILTTLNLRFKLSQVVVFGSLVQGKGAAKALIETLNLVNHYDFDVIILARGGGSFEDLNAFNDVELALSIFNSKTPIVTGIGHDVDFTIADFVSDYRAATPTAAAVKVSPNTQDLCKQLIKYKSQLSNVFTNLLNNELRQLDTNYQTLTHKYQCFLTSYHKILDNYQLRLEKNNIKYQIQTYKQRNYEYYLVLNNFIKYDIAKKHQKLESMSLHLTNSFNNLVLKKKQAVNENIIKLNLLDPKNIIDKGYAIVYQDDKVIKNYAKLKKGQQIKIVSRKYSIQAIVEEVEKNGKK